MKTEPEERRERQIEEEEAVEITRYLSKKPTYGNENITRIQNYYCKNKRSKTEDFDNNKDKDADPLDSCLNIGFIMQRTVVRISEATQNIFERKTICKTKLKQYESLWFICQEIHTTTDISYHVII